MDRYHAGMDIENNLRFGPNAKWVDSIEYSFDENTLESFVIQLNLIG